MTKRRNVFRIRPFNMANFSGAGGYIPLFAVMGFIASLPATLLMWTGLALSARNLDDSLKQPLLERRLRRVILPICAALGTILIIAMCFTYIDQTSFYGTSPGVIAATAWTCIAPPVSMYLCIYLPFKWLGTRNRLSFIRWFLLTAALGVAMLLVLTYAMLLLLYIP